MQRPRWGGRSLSGSGSGSGPSPSQRGSWASSGRKTTFGARPRVFPGWETAPGWCGGRGGARGGVRPGLGGFFQSAPARRRPPGMPAAPCSDLWVLAGCRPRVLPGAGRRRQPGGGRLALVWGAAAEGGGGALALGLFFGSRRPPGMPFALSRPGLLAEPRRASAIWGCLGVWAITTGTNKPGDFWRGRFFWGEYHTRAEFVPQFNFDWAAVRGLF